MIVRGLERGSGRQRDRLRASLETSDVEVAGVRTAMLRELQSRVGGLALLRGLYDGRFGVTDLHRAYASGSDALDRLLRREEHGSLADLVTRYVSELRIRSKAKTEMQLGRFVEALGGEHARLTDVTTDAVQKFLGDIASNRGTSGKPVSGATRNRYRAAISGFCSWCVRKRLLREHPLAWRQVLPFDEGYRRLPTLSAAEYRDYLAALDWPELALYSKLLIHSGADVQEIANLKVEECELDRELPRLRFRRLKVRKTIERLVPIPTEVAIELNNHIVSRQMGPRDVVFADVDAGKAQRRHQQARKAIDKGELRRKDFRHIAAIYWRKGGADLDRVREWLGLTNMQQVQVYAGFGPDDSFDAPKIKLANELLTVEQPKLRAVQ
jgi:integrase